MLFKKNILRISIVAFQFLVLCTSSIVRAQEIKAKATLDSNSIVIGQQTQLRLSVMFNDLKKVRVNFPVFADTIRKEIEVVAESKVDTVFNEKAQYKYILTKVFAVTSFDSGYWAIPPFKIDVNSDDTNAIYSEPLLLQVNTMAVDTTLAIKDIKAPYEETYTWIDWLKDNMYVVYTGLAAILVIIIIVLFIRYFRKVPPPMVAVEVPKIPAHIIAFEKLEKLKLEKLWQEGKLKAYHSLLTDILREYIENRFKIQALEQTTDEILFGFRNIAIDEGSKGKLKQVLLLADLVKFAKENPLPGENELSMTNVYDFVNGTKRDEETINSKQGN
jgi:hypothetical protein